MLHNDLISQLCNIKMNEVEAVKTAEQRQQVEAHLLDYGQVYLDIWKLGINSFLRISDVLSLTMADVRQIALESDNPTLKLIEGKTSKTRTIALNKTAFGIMKRRLDDFPDDVWLFQSPSPRHRRDKPQPYSRKQIHLVFSKVGQTIRPKVVLGTIQCVKPVVMPCMQMAARSRKFAAL